MVLTDNLHILEISDPVISQTVFPSLLCDSDILPQTKHKIAYASVLGSTDRTLQLTIKLTITWGERVLPLSHPT